MGQLDGDHYFHLYTNQAAYRVQIGHPLLAARADICITLDDPAGKQRAFEIYNPTARPATLNLRANPAFFRLETLKVDLAAYESQAGTRRVQSGPKRLLSPAISPTSLTLRFNISRIRV